MKKTRLSSLSFRSCAVLRAASILMLASSATGCVAAKSYDEARSVAESEASAHERTRQRLEASMQRIQALEATLAEKERAIAADANVTEESKLQSAVATKEKEAAVQLVEQLRGELARTGDHLMLFAREKRDMAQTLMVAEQRMGDIELAGKRLAELVAATRDLSLALESELEAGKLELFARDGQVVVGLKPELLFTSDGDALSVEAAPLLTAVGKVSGQHPSLRVVLREPEGMLASTRLQHLGDALRERGVAGSRLVLPTSNAEQAGASAPEQTADPNAPAAPGTPAATAPAANPAPSAGSAAARLPARYEIAFAP